MDVNDLIATAQAHRTTDPVGQRVIKKGLEVDTGDDEDTLDSGRDGLTPTRATGAH